MQEIKHNYMITHSGIQFDLTLIQSEHICLADIAHHLTRICRYGGATEIGEHYSVAQHSVLLCEYALKYGWPELARTLILHDATEAYLGDIVKGLKNLLPDYKLLENKIDTIIKNKYKISTTNIHRENLAKELDTRILLDESRVFCKNHYGLFLETLAGFQPLGVHPISEDVEYSRYIKSRFLSLCKQLDIKD